MSTHIALKAAGAEEHAGHLHLEHRHSSASPMKRSSGSGATLMAGKRGGRLLLVTAPLLLLALTAGLLRAPSPCKRRSLLTSFMPGRCTMALQPSGGPQEKEAPLEQQAAPQQQVTAAADEQKAAPKQQAALDPRLHPRQESFDRLQVRCEVWAACVGLTCQVFLPRVLPTCTCQVRLSPANARPTCRIHMLAGQPSNPAAWLPVRRQNWTAAAAFCKPRLCPSGRPATVVGATLPAHLPALRPTLVWHFMSPACWQSSKQHPGCFPQMPPGCCPTQGCTIWTACWP